ncbi:hypothetical protein G9F71_025255 [Clostridium sp. FP2]|uniref:hypothetical protein n=1 Tax=Clostridium sp. FP2 TaxID=2724481 RepID=UPI0013E981A4|nr:hypothetical protein [Clostridium sp. FP2]MBZ9626117.1 hypothetical protein [Clostridium sp. FP2]
MYIRKKSNQFIIFFLYNNRVADHKGVVSELKKSYPIFHSMIKNRQDSYAFFNSTIDGESIENTDNSTDIITSTYTLPFIGTSMLFFLL